MIPRQDMNEHIRELFAVSGFPQGIGALDGCHFCVYPPNLHAVDCYNYKGWPHTADSAECQLWQRERRLATIKASAPTYLPHREAQAALRSSPTGTGGPHLNQAPGKSYAAVVGAPSTVVVNSTHPRQPGAQQRGPPAGPKKQGSPKPPSPTKATSRPLVDQENTNLRLLTGRPSCSAIDISLASEGARYDWATQPDSWGSDHLPIIITPVGGKIRRTRQCTTIDWRAFRQRLREAPVDQDFLGLVAAAAQAATIQCRVPENHPVPDLRHLNLRAARRKAERRYLKAQSSEHRTLFNRVDAVCRRHANRRRRQSWQGICHSLSWARGGSRAWRLLRSLVIGPMARQPVLSVAIRLGISEQELAERLADRFT
ncbi:hypothetical protein MTO96_034279, partial [Rhipicephalus appendiculatus]